MTAPSDDALLFIGLMSGTSLDGVDAVLADCSVTPPVTLAHRYRPFSSELRMALGGLCASGPDEIERCGVAARDLAHIYAACVDDVLQASGVARSAVRAIGAHGQTVRHRPQLGYSVQLNAPAWLAELHSHRCRRRLPEPRHRRRWPWSTAGVHLSPCSVQRGAASCSDQPRRHQQPDRVTASTALPEEQVIGFDCGPGNLLLDFWTQRHFGAPFDRDGAIAASAERRSAPARSLARRTILRFAASEKHRP